jgi:CBS domain-containing protein
MELNRIARRAYSIAPRATALDAARAMIDEGVGAVLVLDGDRLVGIVSERDIVARVVVKGRDAEKTLVSEVMTCEPSPKDLRS